MSVLDMAEDACDEETLETIRNTLEKASVDLVRAAIDGDVKTAKKLVGRLGAAVDQANAVRVAVVSRTHCVRLLCADVSFASHTDRLGQRHCTLLPTMVMQLCAPSCCYVVQTSPHGQL